MIRGQAEEGRKEGRFCAQTTIDRNIIAVMDR